MIPRILHRTLPAEPRCEVAAIWDTVVQHTSGWDRRTYQSPRDPADWPITGHLFDLCPDRSMESNLVRLEALWEHGGVYVDSDVSFVRSFEPLLQHECFVGRESDAWIGTAVIGAVPSHPAIRAALDRMMSHVAARTERSTAPQILTPLLADRRDVKRLPVDAFYKLPFRLRHEWPDYADNPNVYAIHHWHASWV